MPRLLLPVFHARKTLRFARAKPHDPFFLSNLMKLCLALFYVLEINGNQEQLLYSVYDSISRTMETLATLMKEGRVGD